MAYETLASDYQMWIHETTSLIYSIQTKVSVGGQTETHVNINSSQGLEIIHALTPTTIGPSYE